MKNLVLFMLCCMSSTLFAHQIQISFAEMTQTADVILMGTVEHQQTSFVKGKKSIQTTVSLTDLEVINAKNARSQNLGNKLSFTFDGGEVDGILMSVCNMPHFENGQRYLLFMKNDGTKYVNPLIGGLQGLFKVVQDDTRSSVSYIVNSAGKAVVEMDANQLKVSNEIITSIANGRMAGVTTNPEVQHFDVVPLTKEPGNYATLAAAEDLRNATPVTLETFRAFILEEALYEGVDEPKLRFNTEGTFHFGEGKEVRLSELTPKFDPSEATPEPDENYIPTRGGNLGACGAHDLRLVMEQLPSDWWGFPINDNAMWQWNKFMDIYRYVHSDGGIGDNNGDNEFAGWYNNTTLNNVFGSSWGSAIALCRTWSYSGCGEITESDIIYNPAYSWTSNFDYALGNSGVVNLLPVVMHELGHSWGYQRKTYDETYDYDRLSVMHSYYSDLVEDGNGIHSTDAYIVRRHYDDQTYIRYIRDVGCESYYASNGLINSTTNGTYYSPGNYFQIRNFVVENMSKYAVSNLRVRFFLSTNKTITTYDRQIGSDWYWDSFNAETYSRYTYNMYLPHNVSAGWYYVGAMVSINGYGDDDYAANNTTFLYNRIYIYGSGNNLTDGGGDSDEVEGRSDFDENSMEQADVAALEMNVFPNPNVSDVAFTINLESNDLSNVQLRIVNMLGQVVEERAINTSASKERTQMGADLEQGQYILQAINSQGIVSEQRIVKMKKD